MAQLLDLVLLCVLDSTLIQLYQDSFTALTSFSVKSREKKGISDGDSLNKIGGDKANVTSVINNSGNNVTDPLLPRIER